MNQCNSVLLIWNYALHDSAMSCMNQCNSVLSILNYELHDSMICYFLFFHQFSPKKLKSQIILNC